MLANEPDEGGEAGVIVTTASIAAYDGQIGQLAYAASKGGVAAMTLPAARDLACARDPRLHDRAGPLRHAAARRPPGGGARGARRPGAASGPARQPEEYAALAHIVENPMLNGEVIRLDGALRMPPRKSSPGQRSQWRD